MSLLATTQEVDRLTESLPDNPDIGDTVIDQDSGITFVAQLVDKTDSREVLWVSKPISIIK